MYISEYNIYIYIYAMTRIHYDKDIYIYMHICHGIYKHWREYEINVLEVFK